MSKDVVCGMEVDEWQTPHRAHYVDQTYYFCSAVCRRQFEANPPCYTAEPVTGQRRASFGRAI